MQLVEAWPQVAFRAFGGGVASRDEQPAHDARQLELGDERVDEDFIDRLRQNPAGPRTDDVRRCLRNSGCAHPCKLPVAMGCYKHHSPA